MNWDLNQLQEYVEKKFGYDSIEMSFVASINRYIQIYIYHMTTARDAMKGIVHKQDGSTFENTRYIFRVADNQEEYDLAKITSEAHLLAAIHTLRAMYDIFSQLVNSLVLDNRFTIDKCNIGLVADALPESELKVQLGEVRSMYWYQWLLDFVNTVKHRRLMKHTFSVHFDKPGASIYIEEFEYSGRSHQRWTDQQILKGTLDVKNRIVDCGNALNEHVLQLN